MNAQGHVIPQAPKDAGTTQSIHPGATAMKNAPDNAPAKVLSQMPAQSATTHATAAPKDAGATQSIHPGATAMKNAPANAPAQVLSQMPAQSATSLATSVTKSVAASQSNMSQQTNAPAPTNAAAPTEVVPATAPVLPQTQAGGPHTNAAGHLVHPSRQKSNRPRPAVPQPQGNKPAPDQLYPGLTGPMLDIVHMINFDPSESITCQPNHHKQLVSLFIRNDSKHSIIYKMKSTQPTIFKMRPVFGWIHAGDKKTIQFVFKGFDQSGRHKPSRKDRLSVEYCVFTDNKSEASHIWRDPKNVSFFEEQGIFKKHIRVRYVGVNDLEVDTINYPELIRLNKALEKEIALHTGKQALMPQEIVYLVYDQKTDVQTISMTEEDPTKPRANKPPDYRNPAGGELREKTTNDVTIPTQLHSKARGVKLVSKEELPPSFEGESEKENALRELKEHETKPQT